MKGSVNGMYTTGGDRLYDFGKLYQSFLGYDAVLYGETVSEDYRAHMEAIFLKELRIRHISVEDVTRITFSLVLGTFHSIHEEEKKVRVWEWIKRTFQPVSVTIP